MIWPHPLVSGATRASVDCVAKPIPGCDLGYASPAATTPTPETTTRARRVTSAEPGPRWWKAAKLRSSSTSPSCGQAPETTSGLDTDAASRPTPTSLRPYRFPSRTNPLNTTGRTPVEPTTPGRRSRASSEAPPGSEVAITCAPFVASNVRSKGRSATVPIARAIVNAAAETATTITLRMLWVRRCRIPENASFTVSLITSHLQPEQRGDEGGSAAARARGASRRRRGRLAAGSHGSRPKRPAGHASRESTVCPSSQT